MAYSVINLEVGPSSLGQIKSGVGGRKIGWDTEMPIVGMFYAGDIIYNSNPASNGPTGWICIADGAPGTWTTLPETVA